MAKLDANRYFAHRSSSSGPTLSDAILAGGINGEALSGGTPCIALTL